MAVIEQSVRTTLNARSLCDGRTIFLLKLRSYIKRFLTHCPITIIIIHCFGCMAILRYEFQNAPPPPVFDQDRGTRQIVFSHRKYCYNVPFHGTGNIVII